jgi:translation initiation factor 1A
MPNQQGGKNYKKAKHGSGDTMIRLEEAGPDELYGRVIKNLGNLNMNVYCNDNKVRICKVRGSMRKRVWIVIGDLVIISLRNLECETDKKAMTEAERKLIDRGDIVHRIDPSLHSKAKKLAGINPKLFVTLENTDGKVLEEIGGRDPRIYDENDCGIEFDDGGEGGEEGEEEGSGDEENDSGKEGETANVSKAKKTLKKAGEGKIAKAAREDVGDNIDIDDI